MVTMNLASASLYVAMFQIILVHAIGFTFSMTMTWFVIVLATMIDFIVLLITMIRLIVILAAETSQFSTLVIMTRFIIFLSS